MSNFLVTLLLHVLLKCSAKIFVNLNFKNHEQALNSIGPDRFVENGNVWFQKVYIPVYILPQQKVTGNS